jgi:hypothetical protein
MVVFLPALGSHFGIAAALNNDVARTLFPQPEKIQRERSKIAQLEWGRTASLIIRQERDTVMARASDEGVRTAR